MTKKQEKKLKKLRRKMKEQIDNKDQEMAHVNADGILCEMLEELGCKKPRKVVQ